MLSEFQKKGHYYENWDNFRQHGSTEFLSTCRPYRSLLLKTSYTLRDGEKQGAFHSTKIPKISKRGQLVWKFPWGMFPENPKNVEFPEREPFNQSSRNRGRKVKWNGNSLKFWYTSQCFPLGNSGTDSFSSSLEIFENSNLNFLSPTLKKLRVTLE